MTPMQIIFAIVAGVTLFSAGMVVTVRRIMHAALWLVMTLFGVAVLFAMLDASFFAVVQVVVYIGAIAILIIFGVMLTRQVMTDSNAQLNPQFWIPAVVSVGIFVGLIFLFRSWSGATVLAPALPAEAADIATLGKALVDPNAYVIPFEVASILLLAALVGAIFVASERKG